MPERLLAVMWCDVQVCIEELKKLSREEGVKALPFAQIYKPGQGKLVGLDIPPSKVSRATCTHTHVEAFKQGSLGCVGVWMGHIIQKHGRLLASDLLNPVTHGLS